MNRLLLFVLSCTSVAFFQGAEKNQNGKPASPTPAIKIPPRQASRSQASKSQSPKPCSSSVPAFPGQGYIADYTPKTPTTPSSCPAEAGFDFPSSWTRSNQSPSPAARQHFAECAALQEAVAKSKIDTKYE